MTVPHDTNKRPPTLVWFLAGIAVLSLGYTQIALGMEWRTPAGRIGAGFFPRVVGVVTFVACVAGIALHLRAPRGTGSDDEAVPTARHPRMLLFTIAAMSSFLLLLVPLGAVLTSAIFLAVLLLVLNRGHLVTNVALIVLLPLGLYLLFQSFLNAGLPSGVLPAF